MFGRSHARCFAHTLLLLATLGAVAFGVLIGDDDAPDVLARLAKIPQQARRVVLKEDHSASPTTAEPPLDTPTTATPPLEGRKAKLAVEGQPSAKIVPSTVIRIEVLEDHSASLFCRTASTVSVPSSGSGPSRSTSKRFRQSSKTRRAS